MCMLDLCVSPLFYFRVGITSPRLHPLQPADEIEICSEIEEDATIGCTSSSKGAFRTSPSILLDFCFTLRRNPTPRLNSVNRQ